MREASKLSFEELAKAELTEDDERFEKYIKKAHVLALLAIAEELGRANDREFAKVVVYNR